MQRSRARTAGNGIFRTRCASESRLELRDKWPCGQEIRSQRRRYRSYIVIVDPLTAIWKKRTRHHYQYTGWAGTCEPASDQLAKHRDIEGLKITLR